MKLVLIALLAVGFCYAFYSGAAAIWSYLELSNVVDRALEERGRGGPVAVREGIVHGAGQAGVKLTDRDVVVAEEGGLYTVQVRWTWPVVSYKGDDVLEIPLSLQRSVRRP